MPLFKKTIVSGLILSNDASNLNTNVRFESGIAFDDNEAVAKQFELSSDMIKDITANWVAGDLQGGLFSGAVAVNTTYHYFVIFDPINDLVDCGIDADIEAANRPAAYTVYVRCGSIRTDGAGNIVQIYQDPTFPGRFLLKTPVLTQENTNPGILAVLTQMSIPEGGIFEVIGTIKLEDTSPTQRNGLILTCVEQNDIVPSSTSGLTLDIPFSAGQTDQNSHTTFNLCTNSSREVRYRAEFSSATVTVKIYTFGWIDKVRT